MDLRLFIKNTITAHPEGIRADEASKASSGLCLTLSQFCDAYAKEVADGYLVGRYTWTEGDVAMNSLWGYISHSLMKDIPIPDFSFGVFLAFDSGETTSEPENEMITKNLLKNLDNGA